jgi:hypothetical protein
LIIAAYDAREYFVLNLCQRLFATDHGLHMFLTKTFMTLPKLASLLSRLQFSFVDRSHGGAIAEQRTYFVVHKTKAGRWCWELNDETGSALCRSTTEFVRQEQAIASARLVQCLAAESVLTDKDGREIEDL